MSDERKKARVVLHVLSQRPGRTGSGVTLDAIVRHAAASSSHRWEQHVVVGTPADDPAPAVGDLPASNIHPLVFGGDSDSSSVPFPLPGMSDVMPYPSSVFSSLTSEQIELYCSAWKRHVRSVVERVRPDLIHSHHVWLLSSVLRDVVPDGDVPIVTHCHATGLRQMELCGPHLAERVRTGCARNDRFLVLHGEHRDALAGGLGIAPKRRRIRVVGGGFRREIFHARGRSPDPGPALVYAGKLSNAKGLPWLLEAVEKLLPKYPTLRLHVAGSGAGGEAEQIRKRMDAMKPAVIAHGMLSQEQLADLLRQSAVFVLPSFYEGLPLVLVEAAACGCRLICTELDCVKHELQQLGPTLQTIPLPRLQSVDVPHEEDLPQFVANLQTAIESAIQQPPNTDPTDIVKPFTWDAVFEKVESVWLDLLQK